MELLFNTVIHRPYVFAFLVAYLILSIRHWGWKRSLLWLITGYGIAWFSEYSSIHNGFPYGEYHYVYDNLKSDLLIAGVPFFDSLSYTFLTFAGFTTGAFVLKVFSGYVKNKLLLFYYPIPYPTVEAMMGGREGWKTTGCLITILSGALFTMLLDIVIDPIATMGDKWFLGQIHYYTHPGIYFGVPLTNFGGWFLVPFVIIFLNILLWHLFPDFLKAYKNAPCIRGERQDMTYDQQYTVDFGDTRRDIIFPIFYMCILLFNIVIAFSIGAWKATFVGLGLMILLLFFVKLGFRSVHDRQMR
jgi:putative membrane protein